MLEAWGKTELNIRKKSKISPEILLGNRACVINASISYDNRGGKTGVLGPNAFSLPLHREYFFAWQR